MSGHLNELPPAVGELENDDDDDDGDESLGDKFTYDDCVKIVHKMRDDLIRRYTLNNMVMMRGGGEWCQMLNIERDFVMGWTSVDTLYVESNF